MIMVGEDILTKYSAGIIGFGSMGKKHLRALEKISAVKKIHVYDSYPEHQTEIPGVIFETSLDSLIRNVDCAIVAVPTLNHFEICEALAASRISTLLEKPATQNSKSAMKVKELYESTSTKLMIGYVEKFNPALIELKHCIKSGLLGEIKSISTVRLGSLPERITDVGVLLDLGSHDLNLTPWLLEENYKEVESFSLSLNRNVEEQVNIIGKMNSGTLVSHSFSWNSPIKERLIKVYGSNGLLICDLAKQDLMHIKQTDKKIEWIDYVNVSGMYSNELKVLGIEKKEPLLEEHKAFIDFIESGVENINSIHEAIKTLKMIEQISS